MRIAADAWAQPATTEFVNRVPEVKRLLQQSHTDPAVLKGLTPKETVAMLDKAGVRRVMLSAWYRPGPTPRTATTVISNDQVAEYVKAYPDRFIGIAGVNLHDPVEAVKELERCVKVLGFKGLRVIPWCVPSSRSCPMAIAACDAFAMPAVTHLLLVLQAVGTSSESQAVLPSLREVHRGGALSASGSPLLEAHRLASPCAAGDSVPDASRRKCLTAVLRHPCSDTVFGACAAHWAAVSQRDRPARAVHRRGGPAVPAAQDRLRPPRLPLDGRDDWRGMVL